ncbi:hypothetical protein VTN77DRAFT_2220 [Rasamsonia byssochlamydoides]|uniref:uncharacterized protein n=1 Tax=Rasamsonia byssochlamydoides TaxID=89139 RepID=UPI003743B1C1
MLTDEPAIQFLPLSSENASLQLESTSTPMVLLPYATFRLIEINFSRLHNYPAQSGYPTSQIEKFTRPKKQFSTSPTKDWEL